MLEFIEFVEPNPEGGELMLLNKAHCLYVSIPNCVSFLRIKMTDGTTHVVEKAEPVASVLRQLGLAHYIPPVCSDDRDDY